ncbi:MAG: glycosyltransferase [Desulforhopalus sp.]|nr:glycosyltransferase [Desulforhopalus sp.]
MTTTGGKRVPGSLAIPIPFLCGGILSLSGICLLFVGQFAGGGSLVWFFAGLSLMTGGMVLLWHYRPGKHALPTILLFALMLRLIFLFWPHNSDLNRYVWEGHLQHAGVNPYLVAPSSPMTEPFRNPGWVEINHKDYPAVYGPLAQLIFRAAQLSDHPVLVLKLLFLAGDMAVLWLLLIALYRHGMDRRHGWLYAAHPLPPLLLVGEGHLEPLLVLPLFAGLLALHWGHARRGLFLVGLAATVKISAAVLLPFAMRRVAKRFWPLALLPFCLWLPFGDGFLAHCYTLSRFAGAETFNSLVQLLFAPFLTPSAAGMAGIAIFALGYCCLWVLDPHQLRAGMLVLGLLLLCSPVVHPWYFAMVLPFAVLYRSIPWLILATTATLLLSVSLRHAGTQHWQVPSWLLFLEFAPFLLAVAGGLYRRSPVAPAVFPPPGSLSILVPVCNEAENIGACLDTIIIAPEIPAEILVIDGGSTDATIALAESDRRVRILHSPPGRGTQIAAGYREANGDLLIIVHADSRLGPATVERIWQHCLGHPHVAGGACTARYLHPAMRFRITEVLNDLRVLWCGIAFGDQVQFFRRAAIAPENFPDYKLMEDIELSIATRQAGALTLLRTPVIASHRRWEKVGYGRNTLQVISLSAMYLILRSLGLVRDKGKAFYRYYYRGRRKAVQRQ